MINPSFKIQDNATRGNELYFSRRVRVAEASGRRAYSFGGEKKKKKRPGVSHLRGRQLGHIGDIGERILGDLAGILAVDIRSGLGVLDFGFVLARNVLLVVLDFPRLGTVLRRAARRALALGRHRQRRSSSLRR